MKHRFKQISNKVMVVLTFVLGSYLCKTAVIYYFALNWTATSGKAPPRVSTILHLWRWGLLCRAWESALCDERLRRPSVTSVRGGPLWQVREEALYVKPERSPRAGAPPPSEYWGGRRPSGVDSFHATPISVVLKSKNIGWNVSHPSHPAAEPMPERRSPVSSLEGGPLFRAREEALSAEPEKRPSVCVEPKRRPWAEPGKRPSVLSLGGGSLPSMRGGLVYWAWEEAFCAWMRPSFGVEALCAGRSCLERYWKFYQSGIINRGEWGAPPFGEHRPPKYNEK